MAINLTSLLQKHSDRTPIDFIEWGDQSVGIYRPTDLSSGFYLRYKMAIAAELKSMVTNAPNVYASYSNDDQSKTVRGIQKVLGRNKSITDSPQLFVKISEGRYWPWDEATGPIQLEMTDPKTKAPRNEEELQKMRDEIEFVLSHEQKSALYGNSKKTAFAVIYAGEDEWGIVQASAPIDRAKLNELAGNLGAVIPTAKKMDGAAIAESALWENSPERLQAQRDLCLALTESEPNSPFAQLLSDGSMPHDVFTTVYEGIRKAIADDEIAQQEKIVAPDSPELKTEGELGSEEESLTLSLATSGLI